MLSLLFLPRQFQVMVVENVDERHLKRATWAFPLYLLAINVFVLPIALGGLLHFASAGQAGANPENFVLSLPLAAGQPGLALAAFVGVIGVKERGEMHEFSDTCQRAGSKLDRAEAAG